MPFTLRRCAAAAVPVLVAACAAGSAPQRPPRPAATAPAATRARDQSAETSRQPALPPQLAMLAGLMPLRTIGADTFRLHYPDADGRGVLIGILDSGVDPGVPGLRTTTTGQPKLLDVRDFSGEGRIPLMPVEPDLDGTVSVGDRVLSGFGRVAGMASPPYYAGIFREVVLGSLPAADVDGNGRFTDEFPVLVAKGASGWFVMTDTDGDGSLDGERPVHDFGVAGETFTYRAGRSTEAGPMTIAVNLAERGERPARPVLDFVFDNSGHGTHVAGIAAGRGMFGVEGFDGVAPGAQLLALKIANNARGGISVTGSMLRAMNYAAAFAQRRGLPLVLNLSFGIGNEREGAAAIDSVIDVFALKHPGILFVISAGNDGPGISTLGFPGSAAYAVSVCAVFPGVFVRPPEPGVPAAPDVMGWWSARGGELAKPDLCAPGVAFSNVPAWHTGEEISGGTSMAAPQISGAAAALQSAMRQRGRAVRAIDLKQALMATATPVPNATVLDAGAGIPNLTAAFQWLLAAHQSGLYAVRAVTGEGRATTAAYRRGGLASPADTVQRFVVTSVDGQPAARLLVRPDAPWVRAPSVIEPGGAPVTLTLTYDAAALRDPGLYVATAWAWPATDTTAGPSFGLTNTVIVPQSLDAPYTVRRRLRAGEIARYFLAVPPGVGGLVVSVEVAAISPPVSLYLFEPSGRPYRGTNSVSVGGNDSTGAALVVSAADVRPGVYEAVVVAPPGEPASFTVRAVLPPVSVDAIAAGPTAVLRNVSAARLRTTVRMDLMGAVSARTVGAVGAEPFKLWTTPPAWAGTVAVEVALPATMWDQLTDFGVTAFDGAGRRVKDAPLNYALGRMQVELDSTDATTPLLLELLPAFTHLAPPASWSAELRIEYLRREPHPLTVVGGGLGMRIELAPGATERVRFEAVPDSGLAPGLVPLYEVRAATDPSTWSVRQGTAGATP